MKNFNLATQLAFLALLGCYHTGYAQSDTLSLFTGLNEYKAPYYEMTRPNIIRISLLETSFGFSGILNTRANSFSSGFEYERALDTLLGIGLNIKSLMYGMSISNVSYAIWGIGAKVGGFLTKYFDLGRSKTKFFISPYANAGLIKDILPIGHNLGVLFYLDMGAVFGIDFTFPQRASIGLDIGYKFVRGFHFFSIGGVFRPFQIHF